MELTINVDEKKFSDLLNNQLDSFTEQELHHICTEGLLKQLSDPEQFARLFVSKNTGYGYHTDSYYANDLLKEAAKKVDLSPLFKDFQEQVITYLKENHDKIIKDLMADIFMRGFSEFLYNSEFSNRMRMEFSNHLYEMQKDTEQKFHNAIDSLR